MGIDLLYYRVPTSFSLGIDLLYFRLPTSFQWGLTYCTIDYQPYSTEILSFYSADLNQNENECIVSLTIKFCFSLFYTLKFCVFGKYTQALPLLLRTCVQPTCLVMKGHNMTPSWQGRAGEGGRDTRRRLSEELCKF